MNDLNPPPRLTPLRFIRPLLHSPYIIFAPDPLPIRSSNQTGAKPVPVGTPLYMLAALRVLQYPFYYNMQGDRNCREYPRGYFSITSDFSWGCTPESNFWPVADPDNRIHLAVGLGRSGGGVLDPDYSLFITLLLRLEMLPRNPLLGNP